MDQKYKKELPEIRKIGHFEIYLLRHLTDTRVYKCILGNSLAIVFERFILEIRLTDGVVSSKVMHIRFNVSVYLS